MATTSTPTTTVRSERERGPRALVRSGQPNVPTGERTLSVLGGAALVALAMRRANDWQRWMLLGAGGFLVERGLTGQCMAYRAMGVSRAGGQFQAAHAGVDEAHATHIQRTMTIARPRRELYAFWRDLTNLPRFMDHLERVTILSDARSRWVAKAPAGMSIAWDAVITMDREGEVLAWESVEPTQVANRGRVTFRDAPADRGTIVSVEISYEAPGGAIGRALATLFGENPDRQVREDLRHFKQLMETGETPTTDGQPSCRD